MLMTIRKKIAVWFEKRKRAKTNEESSVRSTVETGKIQLLSSVIYDYENNTVQRVFHKN